MEWKKSLIYLIVVIVVVLFYQFNLRYQFREDFIIRYDRITEHIEKWNGSCECWKTVSTKN